MMKRLLLLTVIALTCLSVKAQFSGTKLTEYQFGKLPNANEKHFHSVYSRLLLHYRISDFKINAGMQLYQTPFSERNYVDPSWIGVNYRKKGWEIKAGNFNETLGRGILLRSYTIQGAILEDQGLLSLRK